MRMWGRIPRGTVVYAAILLMVGCAHHHTDNTPISYNQAPPAAMPRPPLGAAPGLVLPEPDQAGHYHTINSGLGDEEALWHVRAALNVAALMCGRQPGGRDIVQVYNRLLTTRKAALAAAYTAEKARFVGAAPSALDEHMTKLYNFFAQPPAQIGFCVVASGVAQNITEMSDANLPRFAEASIIRLEAPVLDYYRSYAAYRRELARWSGFMSNDTILPAPAVVAAARVVPVAGAGAAAGGTWRIQLGAFTGRAAAEAAWARVRTRLPALARYQPRYEAVAASPLVRLQLGSAAGRDEALKLCAAAATGGFDCLPVAR